METFMARISTKIPPISHIHQAPLHSVEPSFFAFQLIAIWVIESDTLSRRENSFDSDQKLNYRAEQVGRVSKLWISTTHLQHLSHTVLIKYIKIRFFLSEPSTHVWRRISDNEIYLHLIDTTSLPKKIKQFSEQALKNGAILLQRTLDQGILSFCCWLRCSPQIDFHKKYLSLAAVSWIEGLSLVKVRLTWALLAAWCQTLSGWPSHFSVGHNCYRFTLSWAC